MEYKPTTRSDWSTLSDSPQEECHTLIAQPLPWNWSWGSPWGKLKERAGYNSCSYRQEPGSWVCLDFQNQSQNETQKDSARKPLNSSTAQQRFYRHHHHHCPLRHCMVGATAIISSGGEADFWKYSLVCPCLKFNLQLRREQSKRGKVHPKLTQKWPALQSARVWEGFQDAGLLIWKPANPGQSRKSGHLTQASCPCSGHVASSSSPPQPTRTPHPCVPQQTGFPNS